MRPAATGHGAEAVRTAASFLVVEKMRDGMSPTDACLHVCQRIVDRHKGRPLFNVKLVAMNKDGVPGQGSVRGAEAADGFTGIGYAIHDEGGHRLEPGEALLPPMTEEGAELDPVEVNR